MTCRECGANLYSVSWFADIPVSVHVVVQRLLFGILIEQSLYIGIRSAAHRSVSCDRGKHMTCRLATIHLDSWKERSHKVRCIVESDKVVVVSLCLTILTYFIRWVIFQSLCKGIGGKFFAGQRLVRVLFQSTFRV